MKKFDRRKWPHWNKYDKSLDVREYVMKRDSLTDCFYVGGIVAGLWICPYSGKVVTDGSRIDVDHVVSLREAHTAGGRNWSDQMRSDFANDPENLIACFRSTNRSKGSMSPAEGMPPNVSGWAVYLKRREHVQKKYGLLVSQQERAAVKFYRRKWSKHRHFIKAGRIRLFLERYVLGSMWI